MPGLDDWANACSVFLLLTAFVPWFRAWRGASGTALRGGLIWGAAAIGLAIAAQTEAVLGDATSSERICYIASIAVLCGLTWPLNARKPGVRAWAWLTGSLVLVFLIPWLGSSDAMRGGMGRSGSFRLDAPWSVFYVMLGGVGVANYLPTRFRTSAVILGVGLGFEFAGVAMTGWSAAARGHARSAFALALGAACWSGWWSVRREGAERGRRVDRIWVWFRDRWGAAWGSRIRDQFNRSAVIADWPFRLTWRGLEAVSDSTGSDVAAEAQAEATLRGLLRRFAEPERLDRAAGAGRADRDQSGGMPDATIWRSS
ncbi:hypothetical protein [Planctomyces sp. SH-PL62]|uniref:hypothetical protein n=1 Tax=Planctomyces sp. SH-PL62 TaxID=1636152 RepID=UPI0012E93149|nr:hypothetical protein [Planctomyces sp. SH-PL62]